MKLLPITIFLIGIFTSCQNDKKENQVVQKSKDIQQPATVERGDSHQAVIQKEMPGDTAIKVKSAYRLALTSNALQLVNGETGSTAEITFGQPLDQMVETLNKVLQSKVASLGINTDCGAGSLKMAVWKNGLNIIFKKQKSKGEWQFAGWYLGKPSGSLKTVQTMAGIGIGSTREEMESAYVIKVTKTSLGNEFSTSSGLYGIFNGNGKNAKVTDMWSGLTCIFR